MYNNDLALRNSNSASCINIQFHDFGAIFAVVRFFPEIKIQDMSGIRWFKSIIITIFYFR